MKKLSKFKYFALNLKALMADKEYSRVSMANRFRSYQAEIYDKRSF